MYSMKKHTCNKKRLHSTLGTYTVQYAIALIVVTVLAGGFLAYGTNVAASISAASANMGSWLNGTTGGHDDPVTGETTKPGDPDTPGGGEDPSKPGGDHGDKPGGTGSDENDPATKEPDPEYGKAFAVYSADDNTLTFYKRKAIPAEGIAFEGKTATKVFTGIESTLYSYDDNVIPEWTNDRDIAEAITTATVADDGIKPVSCAYWFSGCKNMTSFDIDKLDKSAVEDTSWMFQGCTSLKSIGLAGNNWFRLTKANSMFMNCSGLESIDLTKFDDSTIKSAERMFEGCSSLTALDLSSWNTVGLTDMYYIFGNCSSLEDINIDGWDTSKVTDMRGVFSGCTGIEKLDLADFNTSSVTEMGDMFGQMDKLYSVTMGKNFKWVVSKKGTPYLPAQSADTIPGADGFWYEAKKGASYAPEDVPCQNTETYVAVNPIHAFAVYSEYSQEVKLYKRSGMPKEGEQFEGMQVSKVIDGLESIQLDGSTTNLVGSTNVKSVKVVDKGIQPVSCAYWFNGMSDATSIDVNKLDTSNTKDMTKMFADCSAVASLYIPNLDTRNATVATDMFKGTLALETITIGKNFKWVGTDGYFETPSVEYIADADGKWYDESTNKGYVPSKVPDAVDTTYVASSPIKTFAVYSADDDSLSFYHRKGIPSEGDTFNGKTATYVYRGVASTQYGRVPNMDDAGNLTGGYTTTYPDWTSGTKGVADKVTKAIVVDDNVSPVSCALWFSNMQNLTSVDIKKLDSTNVTSTYGMFADCAKLTNIDLTAFNTSGVLDMARMFTGDTALTGLSEKFDTSNVANMSEMFSGCTSFTALDLSKWKTGSVLDMSSMFARASNLTNINIKGWDTSHVKNMGSMFSEDTKLSSIDVTGFDTSAVTDMSWMFNLCPALTTIDLSKFNTSNVTNMAGMFQGDTGLTSLDVSGFDTGNVTSLYRMFDSCEKLATIDVSGFNTASCNNMYGMFTGCSELTGLNLGGFNTSQVRNTAQMFKGDAKIKKLDLSSFDMSLVTDSTAELTQQLEDAKTAYETAKQATVDAKAALDAVNNKTGATADEIATAEQAVKDAQTAETNAKNDLDFAQNQLDNNQSDMYEMFDGMNLLDTVTVSDKFQWVGTDGYLPKPNDKYIKGATGVWYADSDASEYAPNEVPSHKADTYYAVCPVKITGTISGKASYLETLTANATDKPAGKVEAYSYQWQRKDGDNWVNIDGATAASYQVGKEDIAKNLRCHIEGSRNGKVIARTDTKETDTVSKASVAVSISISGEAVSGGKMTANIDGLPSDDTLRMMDGKWQYSEDGKTWTDSKLPLGDDAGRTITLSGKGEDPLGKYYRFVAAGITSDYYDIKDTTSKAVGPVTEPQAFAVYSADDQSFDFYKRPGMPKAGDSFEGKTATAVYTGIEKDTYTYKTFPWKDVSNSIQSATIVDSDISPVSCALWFSNMQNLTTITGLENLDTSNVTRMNQMFYNCPRLTTLDLSEWNTSNVTDMSGIFFNCSSLTTITGLDKLDTTNVTDMSYMFSGCSSLTILDLSGWNTSNVTDMYYMFSDCIKLAALNLSNFNTANVTDMYYMFSDCSSLTTIIGLENLDTTNVTSMDGMFMHCWSLTTLNLSNWDTSNVTDIEYMFAYCSSLTTLDLSGWNTTNVTTMSYMFNAVNQLNTITIGNKFQWVGPNSYLPAPDSNYISGANGKWYAESDGVGYAPEDVPGGKADTYTAVKPTTYAFAVYSTDDGGLRFYKRKKVPAAGSTFDGRIASSVYENIETEAYSSALSVPWNGYRDTITKVIAVDEIAPKSMGYWFYNCSKIASVDLGKVDTSGTTDMQRLFEGCSSLTAVDLSNFNTGNVINMAGMFDGCTGIKALDLSNFNTDKVTAFADMFNGCQNLTTLDMSSFSTKSLRSDGLSFNNMFSECMRLKKVKVGSGWTWESKKVLLITYDNHLPAPDSSYISGADGKWYGESDGKGYTTASLPSGKADTYYAVKSMIPVKAQAFAVYSADDNSLNFYKRSSVPETGSVFEGKTATAVYTGIESSTTNPGFSKDVTNITVVDDGIAPTNIKTWFASLASLTTANLSKLDTSKITDLSQTFFYSDKLTTVDLTGWDTSNVTNMTQMFAVCRNLTTIKGISDLDVSKVTTMKTMFYQCVKLQTLDLSKWSTRRCTDMSNMFASTGLTKLILGPTSLNSTTQAAARFVTTAGINMTDMFKNSTKLTEITVGNYFTFDNTRGPLPTPTGGAWISKRTGTAYLPANMPSGKADTYYAAGSTAAQNMSTLSRLGRMIASVLGI